MGITGDGALTLLAPSNEAFRRIGQANLDALLSNQKKLTEILQLHVIRRRLSSDEIIQNPLFSEVSPLHPIKINHHLSISDVEKLAGNKKKQKINNDILHSPPFL